MKVGLNRGHMKAGLPWRARKQLYEQASNQLDNGRETTEILRDYRDRLLRRGRKKSAAAIHAVYLRVVDGKSLMESMSGSLTDLERSVLGSGEQAGKLADAMRLVLDVRARTTRMQQKVLASFFAPAVYLLALYLVLFVIGDFIVPQFTMALPIKKWTGWAYALYVMGQIAVGWAAPIIFLVLAVALALTWWALPRWTGQQRIPGRSFFDKHVFPFTVFREMTGFTWLLSYVALLRAGVPDIDALGSQILTASPWTASRLRPIQSGLRNGLNMAAAMRRPGHDFPSMDLIDEIEAYVGLAGFPEKIETVTKQYAEVLERRLVFKGILTSAVFSGVMFLMMGVLQLGANSISALLGTSMGST